MAWSPPNTPEPRDDSENVGPNRIKEHAVLGNAIPRTAVAFTFEGRRLAGFEGEPIGATLLAHGVRVLRHSRSGAPRGLYCAIGHCFECRVTVDGRHHERACLTPLRDGMKVELGEA